MYIIYKLIHIKIAFSAFKTVSEISELLFLNCFISLGVTFEDALLEITGTEIGLPSISVAQMFPFNEKANDPRHRQMLISFSQYKQSLIQFQASITS